MRILVLEVYLLEFRFLPALYYWLFSAGERKKIRPELINNKKRPITAPTQKWQFTGSIKLCASIKVCAWLTVKCSEIATFG